MRTIRALRLLQEETKAKVFLVGGFVRDYMRKRTNDDLDTIVRGLSSKAIVKHLENYGGVKEITLAINNDSFTTDLILFRGHGDKTIAQIILPRRSQMQIAHKNNTLKQDSEYRDFRINAMYLPIDYQSKADVIDKVNGIEDIKRRRISTVSDPDVCIKMSPIRMIRAVSLAAHTGYWIDDDLKDAIKRNASLLGNVVPETIRKELNKILLSRKPSKYLILMRQLGILYYVIPELDKCFGVKQDEKYHKYDVFMHCVLACDNIEQDLTLRLAALLHDVGKPETRKVIGDRVTFHKHEVYSVKLARAFLNRLKYDGRTKDAVMNLVRLHMYHYTREYTNSAVRRFIKKAEITKDSLNDLENHPLFKIRQAERLGNGFKTDPVTARQRDFEKRIREVFEKGGGLEVKDLDINGHIILEAFDFDSRKDGEKIKGIFDYLLDKVQRDKTLNNRMSLIELTLEYLKSHEHSEELKTRQK